MYPDRFPRNQWYVAARTDEVDRALLSRWILGDPVVLYRRGAGDPVALVDRCVHRQMPLSMGSLQEDDLTCGYHGLVYGPDGRCKQIPGQANVPSAVRVQSYPLFERWGLVWIWMGDPSLADQSRIPNHEFVRSEGWTTATGTLHVRGRAQLMNENLLDLSHVPFLHAGSIGSRASAGAPVSALDFDDTSVRVTRKMSNIDCAPFFAKTMQIDGRIDREQMAEFFAPGFHITHTVVILRDGTPARTNLTAHCITPETRTSCHYIWAAELPPGRGLSDRRDRGRHNTCVPPGRRRDRSDRAHLVELRA